MKNTYAVVGLGIFGYTVALELSRLGHDVIGIDLDPNLVNEIAEKITQAVIADAQDEKVLRDLGVHECDGVVIAIGEDIEANILATLIVKGMPKPKVWAKAHNPNHHKILEKLGTDHIVHPEHEAGLRLARSMVYPEVMDYISFGDDNFAVEVRASERLAGQDMGSLHLAENDLQCLLIKNQDQVLIPPPQQYEFKLNDKILLWGTLRNLRKISKYL
jgi:trk system potassium uptake protein TrkA